MKNTIRVISILLLAAFAISCGQRNENKNEHEYSGDDAGQIQLNDGAVWKANPETTKGISKMVDLMANMSDKRKEHVPSYNKTGERLQEEFNLIIEKCTMTGEAHDQLHNYLLPMKEMFEAMSSSDLNACKVGYDKLNDHLAEYHSYFQ